MRVMVIEHEADAGLGFLAGWLPAAGVECEIVRPYLGETMPGRAADGLIVLGGEPSAWQDEDYPWLPATRDLIARSVAEEVPTLGICLGAQLMTMACGGTVERGRHGLEIGIAAIDPLPAAAGDPVLGRLRPGTPALQYHYDVSAVIPPGAVLLATGATYPHQAYRLGPAAWAVQFHPEATPEIFTSWTAASADGLAAQGYDVAALDRAAVRAGERLAEAWRPLADGFASAVRRQREFTSR
ncbi:type 1 glutamine amidotransferase [Thermopolyspora sp. NPDC052614]|uniref:type 1 glutamine amidotransferase n=1 Tax=Thermopolyspora sp. NPDC052614 TaxID=3155682 RepID=UPI00343E8C3F